MGNANVLTFLQELLQRLFTKSPKFFKIWTIISGTLVLITGIPDFITFLNINGFTLPNLWNTEVTKAVAWASRAALFMSLLTTQSKPVGVVSTNDGAMVIKATDDKQLPFTAATEQKSADKHEVEKVEVNKVTN